MPTLADLQADPDAQPVLVLRSAYRDGAGVESVLWVSQGGWIDAPGGLLDGAYVPPLLETGLTIERRVDALDLAASFGAYGELVVMNDRVEHEYRDLLAGAYAWSIDDRQQLLYLVGTLGDGRRVELADVEATPLLAFRGQGAPEVGEQRCVLRVREDARGLEKPLQPVTYSPACVSCPGTVAGAVSLGDVLDFPATGTISGWFRVDDPTRADQYLVYKENSGAGTGWSLKITTAGALHLVAWGQSPRNSISADGVVFADRWLRWEVVMDAGAGTRTVRLDGVAVVTTSSVTGTPAGNSQALELGRGLLGDISRLCHWSSAQTIAQGKAVARVPLAGTESGLSLYVPLDEGVGTAVASQPAGGATGTLGTGATWATAGWPHSALAGKHVPLVLGAPLRSPVDWIEPSLQIGQVSQGAVALVTGMTSNGEPILESDYTWTKATGTVTLTSGSVFGDHAVAPVANNLWGTAGLFGSSSRANATITSPTGSRWLSGHWRPDSADGGLHYMAAFRQAGSTVGAWGLLIYPTASQPNRVCAFAYNDAGGVFEAFGGDLPVGRRSHVVANLLTTGGSPLLSVWVDGELAGSVTVSGAWTTARTTFGVGIRPDTNSFPFVGAIDDVVYGSGALSEGAIQALHLLPATGFESGFVGGWHFDDATSSTTPATAANMSGGTALTLTSVTWTAGRCAPVDLVRWCYLEAGYEAEDLDDPSFRACLAAVPGDCGLTVTDAAIGREVLTDILGGLGFVADEQAGVVYLRRFEGVPAGDPYVTLSSAVQLRAEPIADQQGDPAVSRWLVHGARNGVVIPAGQVAAGLETSDPAAFAYVQEDGIVVPRGDASIQRTAVGGQGRFPLALERERRTVLVHERDLRAEGDRLLALHRHGADVRSVPAFDVGADVPLFGKVAVDVEAADMDAAAWVVIGYVIRDGLVDLILWRPGTA